MCGAARRRVKCRNRTAGSTGGRDQLNVVVGVKDQRALVVCIIFYPSGRSKGRLHSLIQPEHLVIRRDALGLDGAA